MTDLIEEAYQEITKDMSRTKRMNMAVHLLSFCPQDERINKHTRDAIDKVAEEWQELLLQLTNCDAIETKIESIASRLSSLEFDVAEQGAMRDVSEYEL